ncbi:Uncharacterised protein [Mycobacteroides abscessus subsp. abscessus]|uniref:hypothetical protein n=1 Tax=Mycobacteroides abscessus TaxID=36809 RepID=UPI0009270385|nr:hypothetical protein [Mycobacteroides abscessus]SIA42605.1 Uncharacterised protein [Mycobacteroides abscessus subsp. abscessus]SIA56510.1 Uncharacterised protein [Mycobacteroides abscessus subsp. abscessus]
MAQSLSGEITAAIVDVWHSENSEDASFSIESIDELRAYVARAVDVSDGASRIVAERLRQITSEGYSLEHDREHGAGQLAAAAAAYLTGSSEPWPWSPDSLKLSGDISRNLERAGALIAAAIDVLCVVPAEKSS